MIFKFEFELSIRFSKNLVHYKRKINMGIAHTLKTIEYSDKVVIVSDEMLKRIQHDLIEMMKDIVTVLDEENIQWCLSGGEF